MSGFIHITEKTPAWVPVLRGACVAVGALALAWYALSDEGLPIAPAGGSAAPLATSLAAATPRPQPGAAAASQQAAHGDTPTARHHESRSADPVDGDIDPDDYLARNAAIDTRRLSLARPVSARTFLSEVLVRPHPQAGFVVAEVMPESRFERMGLRAGDVLHTLDTPGLPAVDESSMVALMQQTEVSLEVYRQGTLMRLQTSLATVENGDVLPR